MKKAVTTPTQSPATPIGENTVLTITIPKSLHQPKYKETLARVAKRMSVPGFRKGKAPTNLVQSQLDPTAILNDVLEALIPDLYTQAVTKANIDPLVYPQVKIVSVEPEQDWIVEAHTAIAPVVTLGDWEKVIKQAGKDHKKHEESPDHKHDDAHPHDHDQELLSAIFGKLIEAVNPKIAPILLEQEVKHQIEDFARQLASHKMELEAYLLSTGKTVETLQQDYTLSSLANLQIEFILREITPLLKLSIDSKDIEKILGSDLSKYPKDTLEKIQAEAHAVALRRKTIEKLKELAA
ncbi:MAG: trigger factor [Candidatus Woesebacteria bacterium]